MKKRFIALIALVIVVISTTAGSAAPYANYTFSHSGKYYYEPQAMIPEAYYDWAWIIKGHPNEEELRKKPLNQAQEMLITPSGLVFISDTDNNRVVVLNNQFRYLNAIDSFTLDGKTYNINKPYGMALDDLGQLYLCDSGNSQIVRFEFDNLGQLTANRIYEEDPRIAKIMMVAVSAMPGSGATTAPEQPAETEPPVDDPTEEPADDPTEEPAVDPTEEPAIDPTEDPAGGDQEPGEDPAEEPGDETDKEGSGDKTKFVYEPQSVVIDETRRIYVLAKGVNKGIIELDESGKFSQFIATATVSITPAERLRRSLMTEAQIKRLRIPVPPTYSAMAIDDSGFIYVTTHSLTSTQVATHIGARKDATEQGAPIRRVNSGGEDVLRRDAAWPPAGDIITDRGMKEGDDVFSRLVDIEVFPSGIYSVLDQKRSKVFTYDQSGNLLFVFGTTGTVFGSVEQPAAMQIMPDYKRIAILDRAFGQITIFRPSEYSEIILEANRLHSIFKNQEANAKWDELLRISSNSEIGYVGKGKYEMQKENPDYKSAMMYFRLGNDRENYSKALELYRKDILEKALPVVLTIVVIAGVLMILYSFYKTIRKYSRKTGGA